MEKYRHTTVLCGAGMAWLYGTGFGMLVALILLPIGLGYWRQDFASALIVLCTIPCAAALMFSAATALTVEMDDRELRWSFRCGFYRKSVPLAEIQRVESWEPHGWRVGVRYSPSGSRWFVPCYCVGAREGIRLELRNGKQLCVETDEPKTLEFALREGLARAGQN